MVMREVESREPFLHRVGAFAARLGSRPPRSRPLRIALQLGVAVLIFGFLVLTVASQWSELRDKGVHFELLWLIPALLVLPVNFVLSAVGWDLILRFLGFRLPAVRAQVAWGQPLLARYVPGSVLYLLGRLLLSERFGVPRRITLASIVYELAISIAAAVAFATYFLISHPDLQGVAVRWAVLLVVPIALIVLHPRVFGPLSERVLRAFGRSPLPATMPFRGILAMLAFYLMNWGVAAVGVYFTARSVHYLPFSKIPTVGSAQALGVVAATLSVVAPAGLGVRDAAFAWAVKVALPGGSFAVGAVIAIAVRFMLTLVELLYVGAVTAIGRRYERTAPPPPEVGVTTESG
jgi:hypothetical protein